MLKCVLVVYIVVFVIESGTCVLLRDRKNCQSNSLSKKIPRITSNRIRELAENFPHGMLVSDFKQKYFQEYNENLEMTVQACGFQSIPGMLQRLRSVKLLREGGENGTIRLIPARSRQMKRSKEIVDPSQPADSISQEEPSQPSKFRAVLPPDVIDMDVAPERPQSAFSAPKQAAASQTPDTPSLIGEADVPPTIKFGDTGTASRTDHHNRPSERDLAGMLPHCGRRRENGCTTLIPSTDLLPRMEYIKHDDAEPTPILGPIFVEATEHYFRGPDLAGGGGGGEEPPVTPSLDATGVELAVGGQTLGQATGELLLGGEDQARAVAVSRALARALIAAEVFVYLCFCARLTFYHTGLTSTSRPYIWQRLLESRLMPRLEIRPKFHKSRLLTRIGIDHQLFIEYFSPKRRIIIPSLN
jgi:hypothetical protein